jgi:hypothetical protein
VQAGVLGPAAKDPEEVKRLGDNLGRFVFGNATNP